MSSLLVFFKKSIARSRFLSSPLCDLADTLSDFFYEVIWDCKIASLLYSFSAYLLLHYFSELTYSDIFDLLFDFFDFSEASYTFLFFVKLGYWLKSSGLSDHCTDLFSNNASFLSSSNYSKFGLIELITDSFWLIWFDTVGCFSEILSSLFLHSDLSYY